MTRHNLKTIQNSRFLLVLSLMMMELLVFSCESKKESSQRLKSSVKEEIAQFPLNQIPHPNPPLVDDFRKTPRISTADDVYDIVENPPLPTGGVEGWNQYLASSIRYPVSAREKGIEGTVVVGIVVNKEGKITNAKILKGIGGGCDEEALRVIKNSQDWEPGQQGGKEVNVRMRLPIHFKLEQKAEFKQVAKTISST